MENLQLNKIDCVSGQSAAVDALEGALTKLGEIPPPEVAVGKALCRCGVTVFCRLKPGDEQGTYSLSPPCPNQAKT